MGVSVCFFIVICVDLGLRVRHVFGCTWRACVRALAVYLMQFNENTILIPDPARSNRAEKQKQIVECVVRLLETPIRAK